MMTPMTMMAGIITYIWPFVNGEASLIVIAVLYGYGHSAVFVTPPPTNYTQLRFSSGAYVGLRAAPMIAFGETGDVGRRTGMYFTILSFGAVAGPPISGAINTATGSYKAVGIYAGMFLSSPRSSTVVNNLLFFSYGGQAR